MYKYIKGDLALIKKLEYSDSKIDLGDMGYTVGDLVSILRVDKDDPNDLPYRIRGTKQHRGVWVEEAMLEPLAPEKEVGELIV